jgi:DNA adenine methylase Dam
VPLLPILKWPGGKRGLAERVRRAYDGPPRGSYSEVFLGSGAVYLRRREVGELAGVRCILADAEPRLMAFYRRVRLDVESVMRAMGALPWDASWREQYAARRDAFNAWAPGPEDVAPADLAALFLWMNRACFNGLWRVNGTGAFNSPPGSYAVLSVPLAADVRAFAEALAPADVVLLTTTFEHALRAAPDGEGDVYGDPPYLDMFSAYTAQGFDYEDHVRLAQACQEQRRAGKRVVLSNSNRPRTRTLYEGFGFDVRFVTSTHSIAAKGDSRVKAAELLAIGMPIRARG